MKYLRNTSHISVPLKKMFFPQRRMIGTIHGSIWALYTALTGITITSPFPRLKILITEWKMEYKKSAEVLSPSSGELELKGTLKLSNMIPVPASELTLYDVEHEQDLFYKALIHKEMLFIRKNKNKIVQNAKILYKQKKENNPAIGYLKSTVDFSLLEQMHDKFIEKKSN